MYANTNSRMLTFAGSDRFGLLESAADSLYRANEALLNSARLAQAA